MICLCRSIVPIDIVSEWSCLANELNTDWAAVQAKSECSLLYMPYSFQVTDLGGHKIVRLLAYLR
jgi:hypothetical protein